MLPKQVIKRERDAFTKRDINIDKVTLIVGGKVLLEDCRLQIPWGRTFGLIGRNGIGKTCLLAALARGEFGSFDGLQVILVE
jgi:ATP-binding cassette subfamily F protein 3